MKHGVVSSLLIILMALSPEGASSSSTSSSPPSVQIEVGSTRLLGDRSTAEIRAGSTAEINEYAGARGGIRSRHKAPRKHQRKRRLRSIASARQDEVVNEGEGKGTRRLQDYEGKFHDFEDVVSSLADTTPMEWTGMQWFCLIILLSVLSTIFSCICGACCGCCRPRYNYGYYGGRRGGGGGGCCSDIFWCLCCFEWCCRDCQDVDACCDAAYRGM